MLRKYLLFAIVLSMTSLLGCQRSAPHSSSTVQRHEDIKLLTDDVTEIPIGSVTGITVDESMALCKRVLGEMSGAYGREHETPNWPIVYRCVGAIIYKNTTYYVMYITWLVDYGDSLSHPSYIGHAFVSAKGDEIIEGAVQNDGFYYFGRRYYGISP